jgi:AraC family transcriptional regulator
MVASRLDEPLLAEDLARACGLSRSRFFDLFAASLGQSPTDYLQSARLRRACELLGTTAQSCKSIATACGFGTPQYFARVFRTAMGQTPGQYRTALGG